jgi:hypothetical protein
MVHERFDEKVVTRLPLAGFALLALLITRRRPGSSPRLPTCFRSPEGKTHQATREAKAKGPWSVNKPRAFSFHSLPLRK